MKGLELSREYFNNIALRLLRRYFPELKDRLTAGLVGNGSECFGFDDEISRDHDWGVDFFIWLKDADVDLTPRLTEWKMQLFERNPPEFRRTMSEYGARIGVQTVSGFYKSLIGFEAGPCELFEWIRVPEENLAMAVNGEVFIDEPGDFSRIRERLLEYFPEPLRLKRISSSCMTIAQSGQYNFMRCIKRGDIVAARSSLEIWINAVIRLVFLLNRRFRPYYKWRFRMMSELPILGGALAPELEKIARLSLPEGADAAITIIESVCDSLATQLQNSGLSDSRDDFFVAHGESVYLKITDTRLRELPVQYDI